MDERNRPQQPAEGEDSPEAYEATPTQPGNPEHGEGEQQGEEELTNVIPDPDLRPDTQDT